MCCQEEVFCPCGAVQAFGEQDAWVRSISQFQAHQNGGRELASLRDLGLSDLEIELWFPRDQP